MMTTTLDSNAIGSEVITETGVRLGWLKQFRLNSDHGVDSLVLTSARVPSWLSWARSRYEISGELVTGVGERRILVQEDAEQHISRLKVGLIEKTGLGCLPWQEGKGYVCMVKDMSAWILFAFREEMTMTAQGL